MNTNVGISLGIAIKGLAGINVCEESFKKLKKAVRGAGDSVKHLRKDLARIKLSNLKIDAVDEQMKKFKSTMIERAAIGASMAVPVKFAIDFESAMVDVKKYIDFESDEQFKQMGDDIKKLSAQLGVNFTEIAEIAASGGQQGLKASEIMEYTKLVSKFGVAFDMSGRDAGDAAAYIMNNFKLTIKELEKLGNQMNFLDDKMSMVKSRDLFNILNRTSSNANLLGLSADSAAALGASMLSVGKAPEVASTALNSMYNALANLNGQGEKFHKALYKMGIDAEYLKAALKIDPSKAVQEFILAVGRVDGEEQMGVLTDMFGKQFSDDIGSLVVNKDILNNAFSLVKQNSDGSLDEALELKLKTTASSIEKLTASLKNVGINLGSVLLPPLAWFADLLSSALNKITDWTNKSKIFSGVISGLGVVVVSFGVVLPALGYAAMFVYSGWLRLVKVFSMFKITITLADIKLKIKTATTWAYNRAIKALTITKKLLIFTTKVLVVTLNSVAWAFKALMFTVGLAGKALWALTGVIRVVGVALLSNPIGLILGGIALVAGLIIANWDKAKVWFAQFVGWIGGVWDGVVAGIKMVWSGVSAYFSFMIDFWKSIFGSVASFVTSIFESPIAYIKSLFEPLFNWLSEKFAWVGDMFGKIKGGVKIALDWVGLGDNTGATSSDSFGGGFDSGVSLFSSTFQQPQAVAMTSSGTAVNVNFSGNFNLMSNDGKFDLESFKNQITTAVQDAMRREEFNRRNRDIRG